MRKSAVIFIFITNFIFADSNFKYNVQRYDSVKSLAERFNTTEYEIYQINTINQEEYLLVGQVLNLPISYKYYPPKTASLTEVMDNSTTNWRNPTFELYRWNRSPEVLIFDTINYSLQSLMFKRLAFFVEKKDFIGKIYPLKDLEDEKGWNGHDYKAVDLANFFNRVNSDGFTLTKGEEVLLDILLKNKILVYTSIGYVGVKGAVISCSRSSLYDHRKTILRHEAFHGLYFTSKEFEEYSKNVWSDLDKRSKEIWLLYLEMLEYDTSDLDLVVNEFMAYMLQLPEDETYIYFNNVVFYRLYYEYPDKQYIINEFFSKNRTPFKSSIKKLKKYTDSLQIDQ